MSYNYYKDQIQTFDLNQKIPVFTKKFKFPTVRLPILNDLDGLIDSRQLNYNQTLDCLEAATSAFLTDKPFPCINLNNGDKTTSKIYDQRVLKTVSAGVHYIKSIDRTNSDVLTFVENSLDISEQDEEQSVKDYLQRVEFAINTSDLNFAKDIKSERFSNLAYAMQDLTSLNGECYIPYVFRHGYRGNSIRIANHIGAHLTSVAVLPEDPSDAIVLLSGEEPKPLFEEYGKTESAEYYIKNFYGTDGIYAKHYRELIDCKERYPNQKTLNL